MTASEMFECLKYAAIAFQTEVTVETAAVYFDQLGGYETQIVVQAVRKAVSRGDRFPTVHAIRDEIREVQDKRLDPTVARNMAIARKVDEARRIGQVTTADEIAALVTDLEAKFRVKRLA